METDLRVALLYSVRDSVIWRLTTGCCYPHTVVYDALCTKLRTLCFWGHVIFDVCEWNTHIFQVVSHGLHEKYKQWAHGTSFKSKWILFLVEAYLTSTCPVEDSTLRKETMVCFVSFCFGVSWERNKASVKGISVKMSNLMAVALAPEMKTVDSHVWVCSELWS